MGIVMREGGAINPAYIGIVCGALLSGIVALIVGYFLFKMFLSPHPRNLLTAPQISTNLMWLVPSHSE